jgi:2,4-didehydro-3-deoxy-L-rhamnonate hydrolase
MQALLDAGDAGLKVAQSTLDWAASQSAGTVAWRHALDQVRLGPPIARPGKILALAGNYRAHRAEGGVSSPEPTQALPEVFCKPVTSVVGPDDAIKLPGAPVAATDYEGELGVVIGKTCSKVSEAEAMAYVAGYLCVNDVSGRKLDPGFERSPELLARAKFFDWLIGKWCDTFCPIGPWLVTADEVADPMALTLLTRVNGEERQRTSTGDMIHSIVRTISFCSHLMTLEPGDVIATGTPAGVGSARGIFLQPGDVVEVEINGLGILRNSVA